MKEPIKQENGYLYVAQVNKVLIYKGRKYKKIFLQEKNNEIKEVDDNAN